MTRKTFGIAFCALGLVGMGWAVFADVGVMLLAALNAIRALSAPKTITS